MIKKRKQNKKRNPKIDEIPLTSSEIADIEFYLTSAILRGRAEYLVDAIKISKQGKICSDCKQNSIFCECEYCDDCNLNECLCNLDISVHRNKFLNDSERNRVRKQAWKVAKELFDTDTLKEIKQTILNKLEYSYDFNSSDENEFIIKLLK